MHLISIQVLLGLLVDKDGPIYKVFDKFNEYDSSLNISISVMDCRRIKDIGQIPLWLTTGFEL
jgi:hypothetical protein